MSYHSYFQPLTLTATLIAYDPKTCRSAFLASQTWASYWSKFVPTAHLPRLASWHSYSPSELRDAHIRYAASHRQWESPSPSFKRPIDLPYPFGIPEHHSPHGELDQPPCWHSIRGTRWAWSPQHSTGEVAFCDLRSGLVIGIWSAGGPVNGAIAESRSSHECVLCHWKTNQVHNIREYVPMLEYLC